MAQCGQKRKRGCKHPYLSGNFAPIQQTRSLTPCAYTGVIPEELVGGQYVRNGGNPITDKELGRDAHWFDGDGMLTGVLFRRRQEEQGSVQPDFVNNYILTDVYLSAASTPWLRTPVLPSIATLVNPASTFLKIFFRILRTIFLVVLSNLPGSKQVIKRISVANTGILFHDGRALATCESGPPIRVALPKLETIGWFDGNGAENEPAQKQAGPALGGDGLMSFMKEWTTGHPKVDPVTSEMILFHNTFALPYVHYSIIPASTRTGEKTSQPPKSLRNVPVPGIPSPKMMHDFGVSRSHTIIMDLPLSLDPLNLVRGKPVVLYDPTKTSRFGVFPRHDPADVRWFETSGCCIFHTANSWDSLDSGGRVTAVNMLVCRLTSASLVFNAGNVAPPKAVKAPSAWTGKPKPSYGADNAAKSGSDKSSRPYECTYDRGPALESPSGEKSALLSSSYFNPMPIEASAEEDQCRLYYYSFSLNSNNADNIILSQYALSAIPFEFPSVRSDLEMSAARYIYGCSTSSASFGAALGGAAKIDIVAKIDSQVLIDRGRANPPRSITGCVDDRTVAQVLASADDDDPVQLFKMPEGWFAQEPRFVPRRASDPSKRLDEDDGFLLFYAFDESQLDDEGNCRPDARSELWILNAKTMKDVVGKVMLPQRVPYGLHGNFFPEKQIHSQRPFRDVRSIPTNDVRAGSMLWRLWMDCRTRIEAALR